LKLSDVLGEVDYAHEYRSTENRLADTQEFALNDYQAGATQRRTHSLKIIYVRR
jgi:hypothetical protein